MLVNFIEQSFLAMIDLSAVQPSWHNNGHSLIMKPCVTIIANLTKSANGIDYILLHVFLISYRSSLFLVLHITTFPLEKKF